MIDDGLKKRLSRMTHDKPEGMYEALHNTAFVQDREVYLRGCSPTGEDISLCAYCANECKERCDLDLSGVPVEEFAEYLACECPISLLYAVATGAAEMREKLMRIENAEEAAPALGLTALAAEVHQNAVDHGWWEEEREFGTIIALCHSELSEALEEYRDGKPDVYGNTVKGACVACQSAKCDCEDLLNTESCDHIKPEGVAIELADCIIRILDYCGKSGIDIDEAIRIKHEYNKSRPYRHGGKIC